MPILTCLKSTTLQLASTPLLLFNLPPCNLPQHPFLFSTCLHTPASLQPASTPRPQLPQHLCFFEICLNAPASLHHASTPLPLCNLPQHPCLFLTCSTPLPICSLPQHPCLFVTYLNTHASWQSASTPLHLCYFPFISRSASLLQSAVSAYHLRQSQKASDRTESRKMAHLSVSGMYL